MESSDLNCQTRTQPLSSTERFAATEAQTGGGGMKFDNTEAGNAVGCAGSMPRDDDSRDGTAAADKVSCTSRFGLPTAVFSPQRRLISPSGLSVPLAVCRCPLGPGFLVGGAATEPPLCAGVSAGRHDGLDGPWRGQQWAGGRSRGALALPRALVRAKMGCVKLSDG